MRSGVLTGAALDRSGELFVSVAGSPSIDPSIRQGGGLFTTGPDSGADQDFREIDCVRRRLSGKVVAAAELRAARLATGVDRVLIAAGSLDEETYLRALSESTGVMFEPLDDMPRAQCPLDDDRLIEAAATGLLPLMIDGALVVVVAPRGVAVRRILAMIDAKPATAARFRFTTAERFNCFVLRGAGERLAANASDALKQKWPTFSAASPDGLGNKFVLVPILLLIAAALFFSTTFSTHGAEILLAAIFVAWLALRIAGAFVRRPPATNMPLGHDNALPVYTIICALYQEASSVNGLLSAIERLDYPREKLDVILAVEADDRETRAAIAARKTCMPITVIPVPRRRTAHQAEGAQCRAAFRARRFHRGL